MKRLQVLINNKWEYVFCRNEQKQLPILTNDKLKAIKGDKNSIKYFSNKFASLNFKISV